MADTNTQPNPLTKAELAAFVRGLPHPVPTYVIMEMRDQPAGQRLVTWARAGHECATDGPLADRMLACINANALHRKESLLIH